MNITEHTFRYKAMEMMNQIIDQTPALQNHFERAETELSLKVAGTNLYLDGLIWKNKNQQTYALEFETKQPKIDASDLDLVNNALQKSMTLGVEYFATWNVRDFILWKTFEPNVPLMQRQKMIWRNIVNVPDNNLNHIDTPDNWQKIYQFLQKFLTTFQAILTEPAKFVGVPIDDFFVYKLQAVVDINTPVFAHALREMSLKNQTFYQHLIQWVSAQGWNSAIENRRIPKGVSIDFYQKIARIAVFLIVNRIVFYNVVRSHYPDILGKMAINAETGDQLQSQLQYYFREVQKIDYRPIFAPTVFDELHIPNDAVEQLYRLINDLNDYDFRGLNYEIMGRVYENLIPAADRHEMGQYFTPANRVDLILGFCVRRPDDVISDWSCGAGTFLVRGYSRLKYLAKTKKNHKQLLEQLWGSDIAKFPAHLAMMNLAMLDLSEKENFPYIKNSDAFDILPQQSAFQVPKHHGVAHQFTDISGSENINVQVPRFDATVSNPPYIRQELIDDKEKLAQVLTTEWGNAFRLNKQSDIYAYFFFHSAAFLKKGGRLGYITSNSWLDVRYGVKMQEYFCQHFKIIAIIASQVERAFAEADVNSAITILERCEDKTERQHHLVKFVTLKTKFDNLIPPRKASEDNHRWQDVDHLIQRIAQVESFYEDEELRIFCINQQDLYDEGLDEGKYIGCKWGGKYLRAPAIFFNILDKGKDILIPLKDVADIKRGFTTGANEFFYLTPDQIEAWGIEAEYLQPVIKSPRESRAILIDPDQLKYQLLMCHRSKSELKGTNVLRYIEWGESKGFHQRPSCASRENWYDLGEWQPPDLFWADAYNDRFACFVNNDDKLGDKRFFYISFHSKEEMEIYFAYLNSTLIPLFIEIGGITNLGEGGIYTNVYWLKSLPVPKLDAINEDHKRRLKAAINALKDRQVLSIFEEIHQPDRQELDHLIFDLFGLTDAERQAVYRAVEQLVGNRLSKPKSVAKKTNQRVKEFEVTSFANHVLEELWQVVARRDFPDDFLQKGWHTQRISLPHIDAVDGMQVEEFLGQASLRIHDMVIDCQTPVKARYVQLAIETGTRGEVIVPKSNKNALQACDDYEDYSARVLAEVDQILDGENLTKRQREQVRKRVIEMLSFSFSPSNLTP